MRVILLEEENSVATAFALALRQLGHEVVHTASVGEATVRSRLAPVDLLVAALFPCGAEAQDSGLSLAFAVQIHNPDLVSILLSDSALFGGGELYDMLFSLRCVLPRPPRLDDLTEIALHFLDQGPVDCAPQPGGPDICGRCLRVENCDRSPVPRLRLLAGE